MPFTKAEIDAGTNLTHLLRAKDTGCYSVGIGTAPDGSSKLIAYYRAPPKVPVPRTHRGLPVEVEVAGRIRPLVS